MSYVTSRIESDPRGYQRYYANLRARLVGPAGEIDVWCVDVSGSGARLALDTMAGPTFEGPGWTLVLPTVGTFPARRTWSKGCTFGAEFDLTKDQRDALAGLLSRRFRKQV